MGPLTQAFGLRRAQPRQPRAGAAVFEQAVEKEPTHLRALGGVICSNHWRAQFGWTPDRGQAQRRVIDAASHLATLCPDATLTALARGDAADIEGHCELRLSIGNRLCERDPANPALAGEGRSVEGREVLRQHRLRKPRCDLAHAEMLLGHGDVGYTQGSLRILSTLEALGMPAARLET